MVVGDAIGHPQSMHWIGPFTILQSLVALAIGLYFGGKSVYLVSEGRLTDGTVVKVDLTSKGAGCPVVEFTTRKGRRLQIDGIVSSKPPAYRVGETVEVYYLPADPEVASIASFGEMWILPTICVPVGLGMAALGVGFWVVGSRRKRARQRALAGHHLPAVVVGATSERRKSSTQYVPIVEVRHPQTGHVMRITADRTRTLFQPGTPAVLHVEPAPPHGYFIEISG